MNKIKDAAKNPFAWLGLFLASVVIAGGPVLGIYDLLNSGKPASDWPWGNIFLGVLGTVLVAFIAWVVWRWYQKNSHGHGHDHHTEAHAPAAPHDPTHHVP
jgi:hypothetical protein